MIAVVLSQVHEVSNLAKVLILTTVALGVAFLAWYLPKIK